MSLYEDLFIKNNFLLLVALIRLCPSVLVAASIFSSCCRHVAAFICMSPLEYVSGPPQS